MNPPTHLFNRNFLLLWQGQAISQLGNQAFAVAMMFWTMEATGSASLMGLMLMASTLPGALLAPVGGAVADRVSRIRIIVTCDALGGLALAGLAALVHFRGDEPNLVLPALFATSFLLGVLLAFINPAVASAIPDLVPTQKLSAANSMNQLVVQASIFLGQGVGGVLFRLLGAPVLFAIDAASFLIASASESLIRAPKAPRPAEGVDVKETVGAALRRFGREIAEGLAYVRRKPGLFGFLFAAASFNFFSMPLLVLLPFYVTDTLGKEADWYGYLLAGVSLGAVVGFILAGTLRLEGRARSRLTVTVMLLAPSSFAALGLVTNPWAALAAAVSLGVMTGIISIYLMTAIQATTPEVLRGRVIGLLTALTGGLVPLGMALGGFVGDLTGKNVPLVAFICAASAFLITVLTVTRRSTRDFLAYRSEETPAARSDAMTGEDVPAGLGGPGAVGGEGAGEAEEKKATTGD